MSAEGGDTGGGDAGGGGKGGGGDKGTGAGGSNDSPIVYNNGGYSDPSATSAYSPPSSSYSSPASSGTSDPFADAGSSSSSGFGSSSSGSSGTDPFGSAGFGGAGVDPFGNPSAPSFSSLVSGGGGAPGSGLNLADPGPVGGASPAIHGGMFSSSGDSPALAQDTGGGSLGDTVAASGGGSSASAFAAPEGVSGTPQLADLVKSPSGSGGIGSDAAASDPGQGVSNLLSGLNDAEKSVTDQWAANNATSVPLIGSDSGVPTSMGGGGSGSGSAASKGGSPFDSMSLGSNPLGTAAAGAGLLNNLVSGNKSPAYSPQLNANAAALQQTGQQLLAQGQQQGQQFGTPAMQSGQDQTAKGAALQQYAATGTLPQGYEDQIQQAAQAAKQTIVSNYANRGMPTDPTKNSVLAQELAQVDAKLPSMREQLAAQLATTGNSIVAAGNSTSATGNALTGNQLISNGLNATGVSSQAYQTLANLQNSQNQQRAQAIANFAASLNGGVKPKAA